MLVSLTEIKKGDKFSFSKYVQKKVGISGTLKVSALYTDDEILIREESSGKGYMVQCFKTGVLLKNVKTGALVKDIKTGRVWKFPQKVLAVAN